MGKLIDLTGTIIGDIKVIGDDIERNNIEYQRFLNREVKNNKRYLKCECLKCGNIFTRSKDNLKQMKLICSAYINNNHKMPQKWIDRGLRYYNPETDSHLPIYVGTKD